MTATWKVAPCLALGNTAVLKMSELSPLTADRLGELALEAGIPAGVLNVVQGYGATAGDALVRHHDVRARLVHRRHRHRAQHHEKRRAEEVLHGAGRQIAGADF
jgi:5-carboxymethyl-2-hydroxymuconic-semialdehyde dehydrogenase